MAAVGGIILYAVKQKMRVLTWLTTSIFALLFLGCVVFIFESNCEQRAQPFDSGMLIGVFNLILLPPLATGVAIFVALKAKRIERKQNQILELLEYKNANT